MARQFFQILAKEMTSFLCSENNVINRVYVIEDGSTDGTSEKLKELSDKYNLSLSQSEERRGYSNALIEGLSISKSEYIFFSDLGGKFDWSEVNNLIGKLPDNDLVIGVRKHRNDQKYRRLGHGRKLMLKAKDYAVKKRIKIVELSTAINNKKAQSLYVSLDYKRDREYYNYYLEV